MQGIAACSGQIPITDFFWLNPLSSFKLSKKNMSKIFPLLFQGRSFLAVNPFKKKGTVFLVAFSRKNFTFLALSKMFFSCTKFSVKIRTLPNMAKHWWFAM